MKVVERMYPWLNRCKLLMGVEANTTSHREKLISSLGACLSIFAVLVVSHSVLAGQSLGLIVASMGASAVLLFAIPHGTLSQPWPVCCGHLISAFVGVSCHYLLGNTQFGGVHFAPAIAVGIAVGAMFYLRCIHPPGGATALAAVISSDSEALGYGFLLTPVLLNLTAIMLIAVIFNNLFSWRRYPNALMPHKIEDAKHQPSLHLSHEDFAAAMHQLDSYVDVSSEELAILFEKAWAHAVDVRDQQLTIAGGRYYSNGKVGEQWSIRRIIDLPNDEDDSARSRVIYKIVAGAGAYDTGICRKEEFLRWAHFEVEQKQNRWVRINLNTNEQTAV